MTAYLLVIAMLFILAIMENESSGSSLPAKLACAILIIFGGLRHETGFDWVEYEYYYELTEPFWSNTPQYVTSALLVEPGFGVYNVIMKSLGFSFQGFLFSITLINMVTIYYFSKRYTKRIALVFLVYFGFVFLAGQMAAIRQTLSYSFLLLAFAEHDKVKLTKSLLLSFVAVSIHTFTLTFVPFIFFRVKKIPISYLTIFVGLGLLAAYSGFHVVPLAAEFLLPILGAGFLATKLALYGSNDGFTISLVSLLFVPLHLLMYYLLTTDRFKKARPSTRITYFASSVTLLSLISHSYFGVFPAFWNRVGYLTFLIQPIALTARYRLYFSDPIIPLLANVFAAVAGTAITVYTLSAPSSLPFVPYQNAVIAWATGDPGDGRFRYAYAFQRAESEMAEKRR